MNLAEYRRVFDAEAGPLAEDDRVYELLCTLADRLRQRAHPVCISIAGSQGSGKSTLARWLSRILEEVLTLRSVVLSIDDFYLTRDERQRLAREVHPLLETRGVPGTHDIAWLQESKRQLASGLATSIPVFDKAMDDRSGTRSIEPVDVIICEGWCWGAQPEPADRLDAPVNDLEATRDPDGRWRRWVNDRLAEYQPLFSTDIAVFLRAPSMAAVFEWRWQQEQELQASLSGNPADLKANRVMSEHEVREFIAYYERITRWMLDSLPEAVDVCVELAEDHVISGIQDSAWIQ